MQSPPIFCGEADYERWLNSALEAERERLKLQGMPRALRPPTERQDHEHANRQGETT